VSIQLGDGESGDHVYGVRFLGTVDSRLSGGASLRTPMVIEPLTSALETQEGVFRTVATCMAGLAHITQPGTAAP
jgi:hypothetical protein